MIIFDKIYSLLKRQTASTQFIPAIDGLRFLAIWVVVADHAHGFVRTKIPFAFTRPATDYPLLYGFFDAHGLKGVLLFFMISGFILGMPFAKHYWQGEKKVELKKYFLRRLTRLEPPYIVNILFCFLILIFYKGHDFAASFPRTFESLMPNLLSSLAYLHYTLFPNTFSVNPVTWSLEIEVQFYLLVPILILVFKLPKFWRRSLLVFLVFLLPLLQEFVLSPVNAAIRPPNFIHNYLQYFLLGFLLLDVYLSGFKIKLGRGPFLVSLFLIFAAFFGPQTYTSTHFGLFFPLVVFALGVLVMTNDSWSWLFSLRPITAIGGMCYTIYLWHNLIISGIGNKSVFINFSQSYPVVIFWQEAILLTAVLSVSIVFYLLIERPCMDREWPKKLWLFAKRIFTRSKPEIVTPAT